MTEVESDGSARNCIRFKNNTVVKMSCDVDGNGASSGSSFDLGDDYVPAVQAPSPSTVSPSPPPSFYSTSNHKDAPGTSLMGSTSHLESLSASIVLSVISLSIVLLIISLFMLITFCRKNRRHHQVVNDSRQELEEERQKLEQQLQIQPYQPPQTQTCLKNSCLKKTRKTSRVPTVGSSSSSSGSSSPHLAFHQLHRKVESQTLHPRHHQRLAHGTQFVYHTLSRQQREANHSSSLVGVTCEGDNFQLELQMMKHLFPHQDFLPLTQHHHHPNFDDDVGHTQVEEVVQVCVSLTFLCL